MDVKDTLKGFRLEVNTFLDEYFQSKGSRYREVAGSVEVFFSILKDFTLRGGKRLRPALLYFSYQMFGGKEDRKVKQISIFMELLQSFLLIHDDIFDNADLRRGKITVHRFFENIAEEYNADGEYEFGNVLSILNGDVAAQMMYDVILDSDFSAECKVALCRELVNITDKVLIGQVIDYIYPSRQDLKWKDLEQIYRNKTATYTYELPLVSGALLAGADKKEIDKLRRFAIPAGIAFQLRDDILGIFGTEEKLGKNIASDVEEGKKTLMVLHALENGTQSQQDSINDILGREDITDEELTLFREIVKDTGALKRCEDKCNEFATQAQDILATIEYQDKTGWQFIYDVVEYMNNRVK